MYVKLCYILLLIIINILFVFLYNIAVINNIDIKFVYIHKDYTIGYSPNNVTGLFTKLIGIASIVGLCIIKNKNFISNFIIYY